MGRRDFHNGGEYLPAVQCLSPDDLLRGRHNSVKSVTPAGGLSNYKRLEDGCRDKVTDAAYVAVRQKQPKPSDTHKSAHEQVRINADAHEGTGATVDRVLLRIIRPQWRIYH